MIYHLNLAHVAAVGAVISLMETLHPDKFVRDIILDEAASLNKTAPDRGVITVEVVFCRPEELSGPQFRLTFKLRQGITHLELEYSGETWELLALTDSGYLGLPSRMLLKVGVKD